MRECGAVRCSVVQCGAGVVLVQERCATRSYLWKRDERTEEGEGSFQRRPDPHTELRLLLTWPCVETRALVCEGPNVWGRGDAQCKRDGRRGGRGTTSGDRRRWFLGTSSIRPHLSDVPHGATTPWSRDRATCCAPLRAREVRALRTRSTSLVGRCDLAYRARPRTQGVSAPSNEPFPESGPAGCYPQTRQPPNCYNLTVRSTFSLRCWMELGSQNRILAATQARLTPNQLIATQSHVTKMTDLALRTD